MIKSSSFGVLVLEGLDGLHRTIQFQLLQHYWLGYDLDYCDIEYTTICKIDKPGLCNNLDGWEVGQQFTREGTYVFQWLIHVDIW